jgi:DNA-directed RNA polymerase subunit M/transcription elongation factor TFIIS
LVQFVVEGEDRGTCRSCGRTLKVAKHKKGRYRYLCDSCRIERLNARRSKHRVAYFQRIKDERQAVLKALGGKCHVCGRPKTRLELHRKACGEDGVREVYKRNHTKGWIETMREARTHPERFAILCNSCHKFVTWIEREPEILARLNEILK